MEGDFTDSRSGKMGTARGGRFVKNPEGILSTEGGTRFDVLNKKIDMSITKGIATESNPKEGMNIKGKTVLSEITNLNGSQGGKIGKRSKKSSKKISSSDRVGSKGVVHLGAVGCSKANVVFQDKSQAQTSNDQEKVMEGCDSVSVLSQLHREVTEFGVKSSELTDGCVMLDLNIHNVSNFDDVASELEEAMAVVSE
ncbi:hypothetical protein Dsin_005476 [Dipteronia sinensis]|uniref:Uncharacterized protein n=1 Tax=Dipteronia sinensis TaxID=43782 RepID=A0AAE0AXU9_9ROSI|nr:hypothetical protein Dsin_005476 [Dipteronia sinensis]